MPRSASLRKASFALFTISILFISSCRVLPERKTASGSVEDQDTDLEQAPDGHVSEEQEAVTEQEETPPRPGSEVIVDDRPDAKDRPLITSFYGNELIREKVKEDGVEKIRLTLRGRATIKHGQITLIASRIALVGGNKGRLSGGVTVIDKENGVTLKSSTATYDRDQQKVILPGSPMILVRKKGEKQVTVTTTRIRHDLAERVSILESDVRIFQEDLVMLGDHGVHNSRESRFILEKNPVAIGPGTYLAGERVEYNTSRKEIRMEGQIAMYSSKGEPEQRKEPPGKEMPIPVTEFARRGGKLEDRNEDDSSDRSLQGAYILSANAIFYYPGSGGREPRLRVVGNVLMTRSDFRLEAPVLESEGKGFDMIVANEGANMEDKTQGINARSDIMRYNRKNERLRLEKNARIDFFDKETGKQNGFLTGAVIDADLKTEKTVARGDVQISRDDYKAVGEVASYDSASDIVVVEGNPGLLKGDSIVRSEKILIYPEKDRVLLMNGIRGSIAD